MSEGEFSIEQAQAEIMAGVLASQRQSDVRCMECGRIGRWPVQITWYERSGWNVESLTPLADGWLVLEEATGKIETNKHGAYTDMLTKLLCSECRSQRSL